MKVQMESQMTDASEKTNKQTTTSPDIWTEMKELRNMVHNLGTTVVEQSEKLRNMEVRATASEAEAKEQRNTVTDLRVELMLTKNKVEEVEKENADLTAGLSGSKSRVEELQTKNQLGLNLSAMGDRVTASEAENAALETKLSASESQVEELKRATADRPKVAFSAGLTDSGTVGPFVAETTLVYTKIFSNIGKAYNPATGVFTAPVRGLYYISFTAMSVQTSFYFYAYMYKNGQKIMYSQGYNAGGYETLSNGVCLELEEGDVVYMRIPASNRLYDNSNNHNIFSGFLLFTV
uniref:C1q domain-containing protein n=1 Tax=Oncorhynchus mykiss TaxID=8022 RepID=A0A8C7NUY0_ONCMY